MKERLFGNYARGIATLEIVLAFAILSLSMGAIILIIFSNQSISIDNQVNNEAIYKAQKMLEDARANSRFDFNLVNSIPQNTEDIYKKSLDVRQLDFFSKQATSTVTWSENGRNLSISFSTILTNLLGYANGNTCSSVMSNATRWKSPIHYEFPSVNFSGPNANGIAISDLAVFNKKLYVTAATSPNTSQESFFVLNLPDDASLAPTLLGKVDNNTSSLTGISALTVAGNYAYIMSAFGANFTTCTQAQNCAQLQVIDISNSGSPSLIKSLKVPGVTGSTGQGIGASLFYYNGYLYVGLAKTASGPEFNIYDVGGGTGSPTNPIWKSGYPVGNAVNAIFVQGSYAYIATPNAENLIVLNISNPVSPTKMSGFTPAGGSNGKSVYSIGNTIYLGRTFGTNEFYVMDASNPANLSVIGSPLDIGSGNQTSVNGLIVRDSLAFLITSGQFQVWDISNPSSMKPWTVDGTTSTFLAMSVLGGTGTATNCEGDRIYIAVASSQGNSKDILGVITPGAPVTPFDYTLSNNVPTGIITITKGSSANIIVSETLTSGVSVPVTLSQSGAPSKTTSSFSTNPCDPTCSFTLTLNVKNNESSGTYIITINGSPNGILPRSTQFTLKVP